MSELIDVDAWRQAVADSLTQFLGRASQVLPALAGAVLILLIGWGISKLVSSLARRALHRFGFDRAAERVRITDALRRAKVTAAPSALVARLLWWALMLTFLLSAMEVLGLRAVTVTVERLIAYLPNVVAALLIVVFGMLLARFVRNLVRSAGAMANLAQSEQMGTAAQALVLLLSAVLALEELGVETNILVAVVTSLVATLGLTLGAAFALGARPLVTHILAGHALRQVLPPGRSVEVAGRAGVVERVGAVDTVFRNGEQSWSMANGALLDEVIVR